MGKGRGSYWKDTLAPTYSCCLRHIAGASPMIEFLRYPFTLTVGFLDSYRMLQLGIV
jgi:hypothetical protein